LESHHLAASFKLLLQTGNNIFSQLPAKQYKPIRKTIIEMVLATDLSQHFDIVGQFKTQFKGNRIDKTAPQDRLLVLRMALKCGDLGHAAKSLEQHKQWVARITEEFYRQGDNERKHGLPISPFMDRQTANLPQSQVGFMQYLVQPMYEVFVQFLGLERSACWEQVLKNSAFWKEQLDAQKKKEDDQKADGKSGADEKKADGPKS